LAAPDSLTRVMEVLTDTESRLRDAASKKIFIEVALLKAIQARNAVSIDTVITQLQQLRAGDGASKTENARRTDSALTPAFSPLRGEGEAPPVSRASIAPATEDDSPSPLKGERAGVRAETIHEAFASPSPAPELDQLWQNLLDAVGRASAFTRSYLLEARPISLVNSVLTIGFDPEFIDQMELVNNSRTHTLLQTKLSELGHPNAQIRFVKAESSIPRAVSASEIAKETPTPSPAPAAPEPNATAAPVATARRDKPVPASMSAEEFKNDPLIQKALEIFKGQIVDVRS
jgi:DNA polymerase III subunit gamma/tau